MITRIYIGSNNKTKVLEIEKIESIINKYHDGYTIIQAQGYWKGQKEDTAIIEIIGDIDDEMINTLKIELEQESILLVNTSDNISFL